MKDTRRKGDNRPFTNSNKIIRSLKLKRGEPMRLLPKHGEPYCMTEWIFQYLISALAHLPIYTAIIVTITLIVVWVTR